MEAKQTYNCETCKLRARYDKNPKSIIARFWHWHTGFCPGWKAYYSSLLEEQKQDYKQRYNL